MLFETDVKMFVGDTPVWNDNAIVCPGLCSLVFGSFE